MSGDKPAEYWIKHLNLVEHPGDEDGYFSVPFEDTHSVLSRNKVTSNGLLFLQGVPKKSVNKEISLTFEIMNIVKGLHMFRHM